MTIINWGFMIVPEVDGKSKRYLGIRISDVCQHMTFFRGDRMSTTVDRLFQLLDERGMEQKELAMRIGTSDKTVSAWRTGRSKSYTKFLPTLADILNTSVEFLANGNPEDTPVDENVEPEIETLDGGKTKALHDQIILLLEQENCTVQQARDILRWCERTIGKTIVACSKLQK